MNFIDFIDFIKCPEMLVVYSIPVIMLVLVYLEELTGYTSGRKELAEEIRVHKKEISDSMPRYHITFYKGKDSSEDIDTDSYDLIKEDKEILGCIKIDDVIGIRCRRFRYVGLMAHYEEQETNFFHRNFRIDDLINDKVIVSCIDCANSDISWSDVNKQQAFAIRHSKKINGGK